MGEHLHKRFSVKEVKEVFERYLAKEISVEHVMGLLKIQRRRFFDLMKKYREAPNLFSLDYKRKGISRQIDPKSEQKIISELKKDALIIEDKNNPVQNYNYSYVKEILEKKHKVIVSLPTIISRAKKMGFIMKRSSGNHMIVKS